jgi:hypothetical protein
LRRQRFIPAGFGLLRASITTGIFAVWTHYVVCTKHTAITPFFAAGFTHHHILLFSTSLV